MPLGWLHALCAGSGVPGTAWLPSRFCLPVLPDTQRSFSHGSRLPGPYYSRRAGRPPRAPRPARSALAAGLEGSGGGAEEQGRGLVSPAAARGGDIAAAVGAAGRLRPLWQPTAPQAVVRRGPPPLGSRAAGGSTGGSTGCGTGGDNGASRGSCSTLCASAGGHERRRPLRHGGVTQRCASASAHDSRWAQLRPAPALRPTASRRRAPRSGVIQHAR